MLSKKIISLGACVLLLLSIQVTAFAVGKMPPPAAGYQIPALRYVYINKVSSTLTISSDGAATIKGYVQKTPSGKSIRLTSTLERYSNGSWSAIKSWSKSSTSSSASILETCQVSKGTYRVTTSYTVSGTNGSESGTVYSKNVTY